MKFFFTIAGLLLLTLGTFQAVAQTGRVLPAPVPAKGQGPNTMFPASPTSGDSISIALSRYLSCPATNVPTTGLTPGNLYRVSMVQNVITVSLPNNTSEVAYPSAGCGPVSPDVVDVGRLPAGNYVLNVVEPVSTSNPALPTKLVDSYAFAVTDARTAKASPWVRLDYSGHWWDPADSGWGLFIWQDPKSPTDSILAAWFTYAADGKPQWYVFQPTWQSHSSTTTAPLVNIVRPPGATSPPPPGSSNNVVTLGSASLDFTANGASGEGKITYKFGDGPTLTRTIKRFTP